MYDYFYHYIINRINGIPEYICECFLLGGIFGTILLPMLMGVKKGGRMVSLLLLIEYLICFFLSTSLCREYNEGENYNFTPFWSYYALQSCKKDFIVQIIMNVVAFVPVGFLLGCSSRNMNYGKVLLIGCGISVITETLQLVFNLGFSETDDVIHNTLGCLMGYVLYRIVLGLRRNLKNMFWNKQGGILFFLY